MSKLTIDDLLKSVCILGAGGKMGAGIALCLLTLMGRREKPFQLTLMDTNPSALNTIRPYLSEHLTKKFDEASVERLLSQIVLASSPDKIGRPNLVFEAVVELASVKIDLLKNIKRQVSEETVFLSNTSSIPIKVLESGAGIKGRIMGFHFYNPPPVQKLLEIVSTSTTSPELVTHCRSLGAALEKKSVLAQDIAGFIGNGHFIREGLFACAQIRALLTQWSLQESISIIDMISQHYLMRPMGIFSLMNYVGLDVFEMICATMTTYIPTETFDATMVQQLKGNSGWDSALAQEETPALAALKSDLPEDWPTWKMLKTDLNRDEIIRKNIDWIWSSSCQGAALSQSILRHSNDVANTLVTSGVAASLGDVDTVLKLGFHHLYGTKVGMEKGCL
ncbi:MAG: 3-hydroxyacyl-CoA dehydrogenase [Candidatus Marinamargulisbacteria bacterium]|jgi:3-hydroxyacyl-CoA dehydrogenase